MHQQTLVRSPTRADHASWRSLWEQYNKFYGRTGPTALSEDVISTAWQRIFDPSEPVHCNVAEHNGTIAGIVHFIYHRSMISQTDTCYIQDLYTAETVRGKGIGRALMQAVFDHARQLGAPGVYWHTHRSNATAMQLYDDLAENTGFVVYRTKFGQPPA